MPHRSLTDRFAPFLFALALILCASFAHSQIRYDLGGGPAGAGVATTSGSGLPFLVAVPNATVAFCNYPAVTSGANTPCTNVATTFTSLTLGTPCPSNAQIVLQGSSSCQATTDNFGNGGVYLASGGNYAITLTVNGVTSGPYTISIGGGGGSSATNTINPQSCPAQTDVACFPASVFANNTLVHVTAGSYSITSANGIQILNNQSGGLLCDPGVSFLPAPGVNVAQGFLVIGGTDGFSINGCEIGGIESTQGTVAISSAGTTVTGTGTNFNSNMVGGWIDIFGGVDSASSHGTGACIVAVNSPTSLTIGNTGACPPGLPATYGFTSVTQALYHIAYGMQYGIKVTSQVCAISSISGNGSVVTVVTASGCALAAGWQVGIYGTGVLSGGSYNQQATPAATVTGCTGVGACSFTYASALNLGPGTSGSVGVGPVWANFSYNFVHDVNVQGIALASDSTDPNDSSYRLTASHNRVSYCGASCIVASRMSAPIIEANQVDHPDARGGGGAGIDLSQVKGGAVYGNDVAVFNAPGSGGSGPGLHSVYSYGIAFTGANRVHDLPATSSVSAGINAHLDMCFHCTFTGNVIGQFLPSPSVATSGLPVQGNSTNPISGGVGIRAEVNQNATVSSNAVANVGSVGILFNSRLEQQGSQTNNSASCVVAGCTTPSGHQFWSADDQSSHNFSFTSTGASASASITASVPNLASGSACTSATVPACVTDTANKIEGVASQKICPVTANCLSSPTQGNFPAGILFYVQFDCTSGSGLCVGSNPSDTNLLSLPVFRFAIAGPVNRGINAGDFQVWFSSLPGCVDPESVTDIPATPEDTFKYLEFTPPGWMGWWDLPGVRCVAIAAKPGGALAYQNIWVDDMAFDVPGLQANNAVVANVVSRTGGAGIATSGGSNGFTIANNVITDPGWDTSYSGPSRFAIDVDNSYSGSNLIRGNPITSGTVSGNSGSNSTGSNSTFLGLNAYNSGSIDSVRVDYSGCLASQWQNCFNPNVGGIMATNFTPQRAVSFQGACTGTATASTTLYLPGLGATGGPFTCTVTSSNQVVPVPHAGTVLNLQCAAVTGGVGSNSGVVTVQKDGSNTSMTCTFGTGTSCSDTAAADQFSVVANDNLRVNFTTQGSETLAGVSCSVNEL